MTTPRTGTGAAAASVEKLRVASTPGPSASPFPPRVDHAFGPVEGQDPSGGIVVGRAWGAEDGHHVDQQVDRARLVVEPDGAGGRHPHHHQVGPGRARCQVQAGRVGPALPARVGGDEGAGRRRHASQVHHDALHARVGHRDLDGLAGTDGSSRAAGQAEADAAVELADRGLGHELAARGGRRARAEPADHVEQHVGAPRVELDVHAAAVADAGHDEVGHGLTGPEVQVGHGRHRHAGGRDGEVARCAGADRGHVHRHQLCVGGHAAQPADDRDGQGRPAGQRRVSMTTSMPKCGVEHRLIFSSYGIPFKLLTLFTVYPRNAYTNYLSPQILV